MYKEVSFSDAARRNDRSPPTIDSTDSRLRMIVFKVGCVQLGESSENKLTWNEGEN